MAECAYLTHKLIRKCILSPFYYPSLINWIIGLVRMANQGIGIRARAKLTVIDRSTNATQYAACSGWIRRKTRFWKTLVLEIIHYALDLIDNDNTDISN